MVVPKEPFVIKYIWSNACNELINDISNYKEVTYETKTIKEAIANPSLINMDLVDSQETRRIYDRVIGFKLSKLLQKKIHSKSAGRVQSIALRMICDKEKEISAFVPEEYWSLDASIQVAGEKKPLVAKYYGKDEKETVSTKAEMDQILKELKNVQLE